MPQITLPDGSHRSFDAPVTVADVAADIGPGLAKAALAGKVDGKLVDTSFVIDHDADLAIVTAKDDDGLEVLRHSTAHLMAMAVKELYPTAQITIGPVIEDGFYYDFAFERAFTPEDLEKIEKKMDELARASLAVKRSVLSRDEAIAYFKEQGEHYKAEIIESIPQGEEIGLYGQGDWADLCRGPHVPNTVHLQAFKLMKVAGAYWRGDSRNEMLTRIYGTAWGDKKALKAYLHRIEEAEKRDHRRFGKLMDLFHFQEEAPGLVFWHDKGWKIYEAVRGYIRQRLVENGYQEVNTPQIVDRSLWEQSGHWDKFRDNMFTTGDEEQRVYAVKPMNCPCHIQIYNRSLHSYRDLPLRMAEFGSCHRNEPSGTLHGLMRVRGFVQDDAHIFCTEDQIQSEVEAFIELLHSFGRIWQLGTIQLDFSMPERLGATYVAEDGGRRTPVMLHRAILGSFERFIGILLEHYAGNLPLWLAPVQAVVLNITDKQADYARGVADTLKKQGFRVELDLRNEKIGFKIREHTIQRIPYLLVVGDREAETNCVAVRTRDGKDLGSIPVDEFAARLDTEIASRGRSALED